MRRKLIFTVVALLAICLVGCGTKDNQEPKNELFTDAFFEDVVEICDSSFGQVSGNQMEGVISFLKSVELTAVDTKLSTKNENGELLYGLDAITFRKSDGNEVVFLRNHATIGRENSQCYTVNVGNLNDSLNAAFNQNK